MSFLVTLLAGRVGGEFVAKLIIYGIIVAVVGGALLGVRQHYVNLGWEKHRAAVERQDNRAIETNRKVDERANACSDKNGFWDVVTQGCKIGDDDTAEEKK